MAGLNPTDGHVVRGVVLDENRFCGRMKAAQLFQVAIDPRRTEDLRELEGNTQLENIRCIRMEIQRLFEGAKAKNVERYAQYIVAVHDGQKGMAPPIILFSERKLSVDEIKDHPGPVGSAEIQIPWDVQLVAIDGETQLAARFEAANIKSETANDFVPVIICHGHQIEWARQVFHDLNLLAVHPNAAVGISMDERDPLTQVARLVEEKVPFFKGRVNKVRRQLRASDREVVTITALRSSCITLAEGIGGVKHGAKPVPMPLDRIKPITDIAVDWFVAVTREIGAAIEDRGNKLAASPPILAAIGAMGHGVLEARNDAEREQAKERLLRELRSVRWSKDKRWEGIAGKFTSKGKFSVGGTKETAYAVYSALSDPNDPAYRKIRSPEAVAESA